LEKVYIQNKLTRTRTKLLLAVLRHYRVWYTWSSPTILLLTTAVQNPFMPNYAHYLTSPTLYNWATEAA